MPLIMYSRRRLIGRKQKRVGRWKSSENENEIKRNACKKMKIIPNKIKENYSRRVIVLKKIRLNLNLLSVFINVWMM